MEFSYFGFPFWRGQVPRMLIKIGGLEVKDNVIVPGGENNEFEAMKKDGRAPFGSLPVLVVDGVVITQALGIVKFLAKRAGFYPTDDVQAAKVDEALLMFEEMSTVFQSFQKLPAEDRSKAVKKMVEDNKFAGNLDKLVGEKQFIVGDSMTVADMMAWSLFTFLETSPMLPDIKKGDFDQNKNLLRAIANVDKDPKVGEFKASQ